MVVASILSILDKVLPFLNYATPSSIPPCTSTALAPASLHPKSVPSLGVNPRSPLRCAWDVDLTPPMVMAAIAHHALGEAAQLGRDEAE